MKQLSVGETRRKPAASQDAVEIDRLLRTAAYYDRLGCANVAASLRALAHAKRRRGDSPQDRPAAG